MMLVSDDYNKDNTKIFVACFFLIGGFAFVVSGLMFLIERKVYSRKGSYNFTLSENESYLGIPLILFGSFVIYVYLKSLITMWRHKQAELKVQELWRQRRSNNLFTTPKVLALALLFTAAIVFFIF
jgi:hypothetical protein